MTGTFHYFFQLLTLIFSRIASYPRGNSKALLKSARKTLFLLFFSRYRESNKTALVRVLYNFFCTNLRLSRHYSVDFSNHILFHRLFHSRVSLNYTRAAITAVREPIDECRVHYLFPILKNAVTRGMLLSALVCNDLYCLDIVANVNNL